MRIRFYSQTKKRKEVNTLANGIVDRYSEDKGLGYILQDDGKIVRVERSSIEMTGYRTLIPGERVTFEVKDTLRGPKAKHVKKL
jgi:CspA family cold shock protein